MDQVAMSSNNSKTLILISVQQFIADVINIQAFRTSPVESLYVDAHEPCLGARRAKLSLQYAAKIKSLPNHMTRCLMTNI